MPVSIPRTTQGVPGSIQLVSRTALVLGGKTILARLLNVTNATVTSWLRNGYSVDNVCRIYFALLEHQLEIEALRKELETQLKGKMQKKDYRFPAEQVWVVRPQVDA